MQAVAIFHPAIADGRAIVHVGDHHFFDAAINLGLGLLHGLAQTDDDQNHARRPRNEQLAVHDFYIFDTHFVHGRLLKNDDCVLGKRVERFVVVKRKWRYDNTHTDLKTTADLKFRIVAIRQVPEKLADGGNHSGLLDADRGVTEA